jgi:predicted nucleotidyltransferase
MWIFKVIDAFEEKRVQYAIAGGYAVALHGAVRGTIDLDLVILLSEKNLLAAEAALKKLGLQSKIPVDAHDMARFRKEYIKNKNLIAWSFVNPQDPSQIVDIIITHDLKTMKTKTISIEGRKIKILSLESLIQMKTESDRPQDREDVRALKELHEED